MYLNLKMLIHLDGLTPSVFKLRRGFGKYLGGNYEAKTGLHHFSTSSSWCFQGLPESVAFFCPG